MRLSTVRKDQVEQMSTGLYDDFDFRWSERWRTQLGVRFDYFDFDVKQSNIAANAGTETDSQISPKLNVIYTLSDEMEAFLSAGRAFHSNDARGTTIMVDPASEEPADPVDPLVESVRRRGRVPLVRRRRAERVRVTVVPEARSELLFVGDAGNTEASRPSRRYGLELGAFWTPLDWLILDVDYAWSHARFQGSDPAGDRIPGAVEDVASVGAAVDRTDGWFGGARLRYLGEAPLIEDNSVRSDSTLLVNVEAGYRFNERLERVPDRVQPVRRRGQRHQLLLRVAAARRGGAGQRTSTSIPWSRGPSAARSRTASESALEQPPLRPVGETEADDARQQRLVGDPRRLRRLREVLAERQVRIRVRLQHEDLAVRVHPQVDPAYPVISSAR